MGFPTDLKYTEEHEWVKTDGDVVTIGITDFAQGELGDIVFVELPEVGRTLAQNDTFGVAESVKTVSDLFAPISGEVVEINENLEDAPELVNNSPYSDGWLIKMKTSDMSELDNLLSAEEYQAKVK